MIPVDNIHLVVDGKPTGKGRPRFARTSTGGRTFTPGDTARAENRTQLAWLEAGRPRVDGPIAMHLELVVERPQSHWKANGTLSAAGERTPLPIRKPDIDNALKLQMDALNGCAYRDDVDVVQARVVRRWANPGEHEHVVIRIQAAPGAPASALRKAA